MTAALAIAVKVASGSDEAAALGAALELELGRRGYSAELSPGDAGPGARDLRVTALEHDAYLYILDEEQPHEGAAALMCRAPGVALLCGAGAEGSRLARMATEVLRAPTDAGRPEPGLVDELEAALIRSMDRAVAVRALRSAAEVLGEGGADAPAALRRAVADLLPFTAQDAAAHD